MNELLGMFGYEEAITREAVEELQIRLLPEEDDDQNNSSALDKPTETENDETVAVNIDPSETPVVVQIPGICVSGVTKYKRRQYVTFGTLSCQR